MNEYTLEIPRGNPYISIETTHGSPQWATQGFLAPSGPPKDFWLLDGGFADGILLLERRIGEEVRREGTKKASGQTNYPMQ